MRPISICYKNLDSSHHSSAFALLYEACFCVKYDIESCVLCLVSMLQFLGEMLHAQYSDINLDSCTFLQSLMYFIQSLVLFEQELNFLNCKINIIMAL